MICRLCLKDEGAVFNIFADKGVQLQVAQIVAKYFWFEPKPDDPISTVICDTCWTKTAEFDEFYKIVEEAHRLLTERFSLSHSNKPKKKDIYSLENESAIETTRIECIETRSNRESVGEENYETLFDDSDSLDKIDTEISLKDMEAGNIPFGDETEITEYLSLDEQDALKEDILHIPANDVSDVNDDCNDNRRLTRAGSKRHQTVQSPSMPKKHKRTLKSKKEKTRTKTKTCGRPKKKLSATCGSSDSKANDCTKEEEEISDRSINKTHSQNRDNQKHKYQNIDERICKYLSLQCDICGAKETTFAELSKHMHTAHNLLRGYAICCDKKFYRRSLLFHHIEKHLNPECFRCQECDKTFADKQCLRNHIYVKHQPDEAKIFACKFCEKKFAKGYLLEQHQRKHEDRHHICEICQKGFATANLLNAHTNVIHNNYGTMCEICAKVIRGRSAFARHVMEHQGVTLPKVQCPKCGAWYKDKHSLQKHIRRHNEEGTVHICSECGKVAPNRSALLAHKRYVHKERLFECGVCKKAFKKQIGLKEHMTMHTGETLYNCPHCTRTFNSNANMHSHRKKMHPKEFAEARLKKHETRHEVEITYPKDEVTETAPGPMPILDKNEQITGVSGHHLMLTNDNETHILISADKLSELVFKVS